MSQENEKFKGQELDQEMINFVVNKYTHNIFENWNRKMMILLATLVHGEGIWWNPVAWQGRCYN